MDRCTLRHLVIFLVNGLSPLSLSGSVDSAFTSGMGGHRFVLGHMKKMVPGIFSLDVQYY